MTDHPPRTPRRAWTMLAIGVAAQAAGSVFVATPAFLIPLLHLQRGLSLTQAGTLAAAPSLGMVLALIAWGALADRIGERWVIAAGLAITALASLGAVFAQGYLALGLFFLLGGIGAASASAASGRVVMGWFPKHRRGLAMGIRQMSQPLGVTVAALTIPWVASGSGIAAAVTVPLVLTAVVAVLCAALIVNPPRAAAAVGAPAAANPYRGSGFLWRIHAVSALLVLPQFLLSTFGLVWLVAELGWEPLPAGILVGAAQFVGAIGRILVGVLSDRVGSRVRPLRWVAAAAVVVMLLLAAVDATHFAGAGIAFVIATSVTVADNGLAFTSVAEMAGTSWAGRALGAQNTAQWVSAAAAGPLFGALIGALGYPVSFLLAALAPAIAIPLVPRESAEHDRH